MRCVLLAAFGLAASLGASEAASIKGMRFWNLTSGTLSEVSLAPAGTKQFGPNQCKNDKDGTVEFDEQVAVKGVAPGRYDIRTKDEKGRVCVAKAVEVKAKDVFSIRDEDLTDCAK